MLTVVLILSLARPSLVKAAVQTPTLTSCSSVQQVQVGGVTIENAKIGQTMLLNFTLTISQALQSEPKMQFTFKKQSGSVIPCINGVGSCTYKLCGGTSSVEQKLGRLWNNVCPVPAITVQQSIKADLDSAIQLIIGFAPTTLNIEIKVINGGTTVGCQSFPVNIAKA
ncbi:uncharacterized protein LOC144141504 [Haemaphysalis longicornis]